MTNSSRGYNADHCRETGGFLAYGIDGVYGGVANIMFIFITFDTMVLSRGELCNYMPSKSHIEKKICNLRQTISNALSTIGGILSLSLLVIIIALTTIQPYYVLVRIICLFKRVIIIVS